MRILYVTQIVPYPPHGGVLQRGFNLLRELGRRHEVHLLAFHHRDELPSAEAVAQSKQELGAFCQSVEYFDLWPKRSKVHKLLGFAAAAIHPKPFSLLAHRSYRLASRLNALCRGDSAPDVVHLDTIALAQYARNCDSCPIVLAHHNIESQLMQRRADYERGWLRRYYVRRQARALRLLEAQVADRFRANITVSHGDADALRAICPGAVTEVIPNGVDIDYFTPCLSQETATLIFTGGMNMFANRDGIDWFLESVWPAVRSRVTGVRLVAIGQCPTQRLLECAVQDHAVEAPGYVADVRPAVARAAICIVPLRVGGGTRLKILDAMAQGKAIVSTTLGAEGIDVRDGEHLLLADEAQAFADRIVGLLQQPDMRRRLGEAARMRAVEEYAWAMLGERLTGVYARAIENRAR